MPLLSQEAVPSPPSDGTYKLLIPVELAPGVTIEGDAEGEVRGRPVWIRRRAERQLQVVVRGFESENAARTGFEDVKAWLAFASCELKHALRFFGRSTNHVA